MPKETGVFPLTVKEAAAEARVHPQTIRRGIRDGSLVAHRVGSNPNKRRKLVIRPEDLAAWMPSTAPAAQS